MYILDYSVLCNEVWTVYYLSRFFLRCFCLKPHSPFICICNRLLCVASKLPNVLIDSFMPKSRRWMSFLMCGRLLPQWYVELAFITFLLFSIGPFWHIFLRNVCLYKQVLVFNYKSLLSCAGMIENSFQHSIHFAFSIALSLKC